MHAIGVPLTIVGLALIVLQLALSRSPPSWYPLVPIVVGYLLQWLGHRVEGNDMGELILVKKLLGMPHTAISPRYTATSNADASARPTRHDIEPG